MSPPLWLIVIGLAIFIPVIILAVKNMQRFHHSNDQDSVMLKHALYGVTSLLALLMALGGAAWFIALQVKGAS